MAKGLESDDRQAALVAGVAALRRRERTVAEMHAWLGERGVAGEVIDDAISELIAVGELDDDRFARAFAQDKRELSGWGSERIEAALLDRGLERSLAESVSNEGHAEQLKRAVALLAKRATALEAEDDRSRALAFLIRRGYEYELAYDAIRRAVREGEAAA